MKQEWTYNDISYYSKEISSIKSRQGDDININYKYKIGNNEYSLFPMFSSPMKDVSSFRTAKVLNEYNSIGIIHRFMNLEIWKNGIIDLLKEKINILSFSVSLNDFNDKLNFIEELFIKNDIIKPNGMIICLDLANASSELIKKPKERFNLFKRNMDIDISYMTGNIVTPEAAYHVYENGFNFVRIGIGSGSVCSTPIETGFFRPPFSAMVDIREWKIKNDIDDLYLIADGGISETATMIKAMGAGADGFMLGRLLAGWEFSPGDIKMDSERPKFSYSGSASFEIANITNELNGNDRRIIAEGVTEWIDYRGNLEVFDNWLFQTQGGMKSALSYANAKDWLEFRDNIEFVLVTTQSYRQQHPNLSWNK